MGTALVARQAAGVVALRRSVPEHLAYWEHRAQLPGDLLLAAAGDSVSQGIGASRPELGCISLVADRLASATGRTVRVVNLSITGARLDQVLDEQLPQLTGVLPDLLLVEAGANDMIQGRREEFLSRLEELFDALPPAAVVADVPYLMHGRWERDAAFAAPLVRALGAERGVPVVPIHDTLAAGGWLLSLTHCAADLFHPDDAGHRVWADALWAGVEQTGVLSRLRATS